MLRFWSNSEEIGSKYFPLREVPILKKNAIDKNHCLFQRPPVEVRNTGYALARYGHGRTKVDEQRHVFSNNVAF